ncbi:hypothetical protein J8J40_29495, partial [Mycobacterium tuberculosis]|nr:hypothetical protein [Mycobacterium tuberculosis]
LALTLGYAALLVGDAADSPADIDVAMRLGYNWAQGPFELIDRIGIDRVAERIERRPGGLRERQGHARLLGDARHRHLEGEVALGARL